MKSLIFVLVGALALSGCVTIGEKFDLARADELVPGKSTMTDATQLLGSPTAETNLANGKKLLQWQYVQGTAIGTGSGSHLAILFDEDGKMIRITHRFHTRVH